VLASVLDVVFVGFVVLVDVDFLVAFFASFYSVHVGSSPFLSFYVWLLSWWGLGGC
jgi:hypothetical protein